MRTIPVELTAGVTARLEVVGRYFRLMSTVGPVAVDMMNRGRVVYEASNVQAGFWAIPEGGFDAIQITSATTQNVQIAVTNGNGGYDRSAGDVSILPGGSIDVTDRGARLLGVATLNPWSGKNRIGSPGFMGQFLVGAVASQASYVQLFNPGGSGKSVYVDTVIARSAANLACSLWTHNAQVINLQGNGLSRVVGGAASAAQIRSDANSIIPGTKALSISTGQDGCYLLSFEEPIIIPPGFGVHLASEVVNTAITCSFEWREI